MPRKTVSTLFVILAAIFWGSIGFFTKTLDAAGVGTFFCVSIRSTVTALVLSAVLLCTNPKGFAVRLRDLPLFALCGILSLTLNNACYFYSIKYSGMSTAAVLLYTAPIFVMIMSVTIYKEKLTAAKLISLVMTFAGCIFVSVTGAASVFSPLGVLCGLVSGICYALYTMLAKNFMLRYSPLTTAVYIFIFASLSSFVISNPVECVKVVIEKGQVWTALGLGVVSSAAPYLLYNMGLMNMAPTSASIIATLEPVVAALIDVFFFKSYDALAFKVIGVGLVIGAIVYINLSAGRQKKL